MADRELNSEKKQSPNKSPKKRRRKRRQSHGSAWHWKQTDAWYYTLPGTKKRVPLCDENGHRIRGIENKKLAQLALARVKISGDWQSEPNLAVSGNWLVARVCSEYIQHCERRLANHLLSESYFDIATRFLNELCTYCGAMLISDLKKRHIYRWIEEHTSWKSPATKSLIIGIVLAAFNYVESNFDVANPLKGIKKPMAQPRLQSFSVEEEKAIYSAAKGSFGDFLFAAIHTGLRPFSELARITADEVEENDRGMMWRVFATKTKKTRKIPIMPRVAQLVRRLIESVPEGSGLPVFRNSRGKEWTPNAGKIRFISVRKRLGWDTDPVRKRFSCYSCRHTFAHRMLSGIWNNGRGCSIEVLAELMGNTPKVAYDHYGREWGQQYQDPLWAAIGLESNQTDVKSANSS